MDNVVYILGAGFSAPLGLPVMSNFIEMAQNLYAIDNNEYKHFKNIFTNIRQKLAYVNKFYNTDIDNIEEVLSILEMERMVGKGSIKQAIEYRKFIMDVIQYYTPKLQRDNYRITKLSRGNYELSDEAMIADIDHRHMFAELVSDKMLNYAGFVLNLFNRSIEPKYYEENLDPRTKVKEFELHSVPDESIEFRYSVITLNYDLVLENCAKYLSSILLGFDFNFLRPPSQARRNLPYLVKLHGSIDTGNIIPPTWNKIIENHVYKEWERAFILLASANYIRIIGYSLPDNDAYVRYLLKASILKSENLKNIDVLCKDSTGKIKEKYDKFIQLPYPKYRFSFSDVKDYLNWVGTVYRSSDREYTIQHRHEDFFTRNSVNESGLTLD